MNLDRWIAENFLKEQCSCGIDTRWVQDCKVCCPYNYSTNVSRAWELVKKLQKQGCKVTIEISSVVTCAIYINPKTGLHDRWTAYSDTTSRAICLAIYNMLKGD